MCKKSHGERTGVVGLPMYGVGKKKNHKIDQSIMFYPPGAERGVYLDPSGYTEPQNRIDPITQKWGGRLMVEDEMHSWDVKGQRES